MIRLYWPDIRIKSAVVILEFLSVQAELALALQVRTAVPIILGKRLYWNTIRGVINAVYQMDALGHFCAADRHALYVPQAGR